MKFAALPLAALLAAMTTGSPAFAQDTPAQTSPAVSHFVTLDLVVTDKSGASVQGLTASDFKILDNKHPQTLTSAIEAHGLAAAADPPVEAMVVLDAVNADFSSVANDRQSLEKLFKSNGGEMPLPTSLLVLNDQSITPPTLATRDGNALLNQLNGIVTGLRELNRSKGFWGAAERRQISLQAFSRIAVEAASRPGRKLLIWVGPGWPALSSTGVDTTGISPKDQAALFATITEISTALWVSQMTVYNIDPSQGSLQGQFIYENFVKGADSPRHVDNGDLMLQVLAVQSGGAMLYGTELSSLISRCIAENKTYYIVKYPAPAAAHANDYHSIEVRVDKSGLKARTRTIYYSQP